MKGSIKKRNYFWGPLTIKHTTYTWCIKTNNYRNLIVDPVIIDSLMISINKFPKHYCTVLLWYGSGSCSFSFIITQTNYCWGITENLLESTKNLISFIDRLYEIVRTKVQFLQPLILYASLCMFTCHKIIVLCTQRLVGFSFLQKFKNEKKKHVNGE